MLKRTRLSLAISAAFGAGLMGISPLAVAQTQALDRVEVTGSLLRRTDAETALPITIIRSEDLIKQGITTAEQAVGRIAANQSLIGVSQGIGSNTGGKAEADLRGLGSNKTLVLLNGRRLANHAFPGLEGSVDLNSIPLNAIDRIEVLRDGASSLYGTDAIGGVINFILRRDYTGIEVAAEYQKPEESGGGDERRFTILGGFGSLDKQGFNILASLDYRKQNVLLAKDRQFAATGVLGPTRGDILAGTSGTSFPGDLNGFEPSGPGCAPPNSIPVTNAAGTAFGSCRYDFTRDIDIIPENDQITGLIRGTLKLGQNHQVSAEYLRAENNVITQVAPNPVSQFLPVTSPFFPAGAPVTVVPGFGTGGVVNWRQVPAGKRTSESEAVTERILAEISGAAIGWDYRAGIGNSKNKTNDFATRGYPQDDVIQAGLSAGIINPFGPQSAAGQAAIEAAQTNQQTQTSKGDVDFIDARVSRDLFMLPAGPLAAAIGAEYRREEYSFEALPITAQLPSLGVDPDSDVSGKRNVKALFAELSIPIVRNLEATLAARYDRYSDSGNTFNPKVALRFQPIPQVLLRGSYNTGFRAPTLYEIFQPQSLTFTSDNYDDPALCPSGTAIPPATDGAVCGQQVLQRFGGPIATGRAASALEPEESRTFTFGVVLEPIPQVTLTADAFWIKIENTIGVLPEQAIFETPATYAGRFFRCSQISPAQRANIDVCLNFPTFDPIAFIDAPNENLGEIKTNGIDLGADWRLPATSFGRFSFSINGTYIDKYEYQRVRNGEFIQNVGRYADNAPIFRWQHIAVANWTLGPWAATLANKYKSGYDDQDPVNEVDSYSTWDLTGTWTGFRGLTVTAGVRNLFDEDPPFSNQNTTFQRGYDPRFTDPRGRTYIVRVGYKFF